MAFKLTDVIEGIIATGVGGAGAVQYTDGAALAGDNTKFYYDSSNYRVGLGTNDVSAATLHVAGSLPTLFNTVSSSDPQIRVGNTVSTATTLGYNSASVYGYLRAAPGGSDMINWKEGAVGINGVTAPINALDISGGAVIGSGGAYAGGATAPADGLLVQGNVGIATTSATATLQVNGLTDLKTYVETYDSPSISAGTLDLDLSLAGTFTVSLNANITTFNINNAVTTAGKVNSFTLVFTADGTPRTVVWPAAVRWADGTAPTLTSTNNKRDVFTFFSTDGGTSWNGFTSGQNL